jgi:hypothetical protein
MSMLAKIRAVTGDRHVRQPTRTPRVVPATIRDLNGNPIQPGTSTPILRRANSGHLFQPSNGVVKAAEMTNPVPSTRKEAKSKVGIASQPKGVLVIKEADRKTGGRAKHVRFLTPDVEEQLPASAYTPPCQDSPPGLPEILPLFSTPRPKPKASTLTMPIPYRHECDDCRTESPHNRCMTAELVECGRPDSETLEVEVPVMMVSQNENGSEWEWGSWWSGADDVWVQIASEE